MFAVFTGDVVCAESLERKIITDEELWRHRPANMFKLSENNNPSACEPLLASLNTSLRIAPLPVRFKFGSKRKVSKPKPFPLLRNKFVVDLWRRQKYYWHSSPGAQQMTQSWEAAYLDLDGDGAQDGLFRHKTSIHRNQFHAF